MTEFFARCFGGWVRSLTPQTLRADAMAGVLGALLVLPQGFAFAKLAGLPPEYGLMTAIVPCVVAALFGSSWHVVSGPTNAMSLALFAMLAPLAVVGSAAYIQLALTVTVLVGVMQWLVGALRLGSVANFISPAALRGFTSGAAALIVLHALPDLLGLAAPDGHATLALLRHLLGRLSAVQGHAVAVVAVTLVVVWGVRRFLPRWPYMLPGLAAGTLLATLLPDVAVIGPLPSIWPRLSVPQVPLQSLPELLSMALVLTLVALSQTVSIAKALAARSGQAVDTNREFRGQGLSNLVGGFFSSYVSCGSLNRSVPNFEAGARTPLAAVFASVGLLLLLAFSGPLLARIALPAIAALLLLVAWALFDLAGWRRLWREGRDDFAIAAATALATVSIRLEMAILLGTVLSLVVYLHRTSKPWMRVMGFDVGVGVGADGAAPSDRPFVVRCDVPAPLPECPQLKMIRMEGEVYFGAVPHVADQLRELRELHAHAARGELAPLHLLVMAKSMNFIDLPAAELWRAELRARRQSGGDLYFHRPRPPVMALWQHLGFVEALGRDHIFATKRQAIHSIFARLDRSICARCSVRVFEECQALPPPLQEPAVILVR